MMENLNKENFWNEMYAAYPDAMKAFCDWIDWYKRKNNWDKLFNASAYTNLSAPKFHDLPLAMQMGIWNEFVDSYDVDFCKGEIESYLDGQQKFDNDLKLN